MSKTARRALQHLAAFPAQCRPKIEAAVPQIARRPASSTPSSVSLPPTGARVDDAQPDAGVAAEKRDGSEKRRAKSHLSEFRAVRKPKAHEAGNAAYDYPQSDPGPERPGAAKRRPQRRKTSFIAQKVACTACGADLPGNEARRSIRARAQKGVRKSFRWFPKGDGAMTERRSNSAVRTETRRIFSFNAILLLFNEHMIKSAWHTEAYGLTNKEVEAVSMAGRSPSSV